MRRVPKIPTLLAFLFLGAGPAFSQTLMIEGATVHTMGPQGVLEDTDLLIRDGRIIAIGELESPADAERIDAAGRPLTPGFFAGIGDIGLHDIPMETVTVDYELALPVLRPEFNVALAWNPNSVLVPITRIEGYTWTVLGARRSGSIIAGQGRAVALDGAYDSFLGEEVLFIDVGADASAQSGNSRAAQWMLLEQAMREASSEIRWTPDAVLTAAGREAMARFSGAGVVVFHVDRASDILEVLRFAARHGIHAAIHSGIEAWMVGRRTRGGRRSGAA